jgi:hypothetical protein
MSRDAMRRLSSSTPAVAPLSMTVAAFLVTWPDSDLRAWMTGVVSRGASRGGGGAVIFSRLCH